MKAAWGVNVVEVFGQILLKIIACTAELSKVVSELPYFTIHFVIFTGDFSLF